MGTLTVRDLAFEGKLSVGGRMVRLFRYPLS